MIELFLAALTLYSGVATYYAESEFDGQPLYCDQFMPGARQVYDRNASGWAAFDVAWYESGEVTCGDWVLLLFDGHELLVQALDAGPWHGRYWVETFGPDKPIIVDLPEHLRPDGAMSWPVVVVNLTRMGWEP